MSSWSRETLRQHTGEARRRTAELETDLYGRAGEPPRPGDLFLFRETAFLDVEWAVLATRPDGRVQVVPADNLPLVGSADIGVVEAKTGEPMVLRGRWALWIDARHFDPELRRGSFADGTHLLLAKRDALAAGTPVGTAGEREVDIDPEYEDWVEEVLRPAVARLTEIEKAPEPAAAGATPSGSWRSSGRILGLAASAIVVAGLFFTVGRAVEEENTRSLERELSRLEGEHEVRLQAVRESFVNETSTLRQEVNRLEEERRELAEQHQQALVELETRLGRDEPEINVPLAWLSSQGPTRGETDEVLRIPSSARHIFLLISLPPTLEVHSEYRLEIRRQGSEVVLERRGLHKGDALDTLRVMLPREQLPAARYDLSVFGIEASSGEETLLESYTLVVASEQADR